ncbi:MAG: hypothetical protein WAX77_11860, partial [Methylococcaceae bacterium]
AVFGQELMTGIKNSKDHVLPVTIKVMKLLGHEVIHQLANKTDLESLLSQVETHVFSNFEAVKQLDLSYSPNTEVCEQQYFDE